ncbi:hypothetical protein DPMN_084098 [Dreissena polymorpha]|uniref:Uncharacterized protein n=1 Tax=Dreissena polymorpha TaxID=45954 RepID=A0A9D4BIX6_DREPO|nr:hypothetical protein DPMN_084098 [Dreissena polymorpha]
MDYKTDFSVNQGWVKANPNPNPTPNTNPNPNPNPLTPLAQYHTMPRPVVVFRLPRVTRLVAVVLARKSLKSEFYWELIDLTSFLTNVGTNRLISGCRDIEPKSRTVPPRSGRLACMQKS